MKNVTFKFEDGYTETIDMDNPSTSDLHRMNGTVADQESSSDPEEWVDSYNDWDIDEGNISRENGDCVGYELEFPYKINPDAKNIEVRITCKWEDLEDLGWDFDSIPGREDYEPIVELRTIEEGGKIYTSWFMSSLITNETSESEATGDDELTIENIIQLLNECKINLDEDVDDDSYNDSGWVSTFIQ